MSCLKLFMLTLSRYLEINFRITGHIYSPFILMQLIHIKQCTHLNLKTYSIYYIFYKAIALDFLCPIIFYKFFKDIIFHTMNFMCVLCSEF